jgi:phosphoribosylglycinamide formyltransferase 1
MNKKAGIAVFASGGGSNAEEIFKYFKNHPDIEVVLLLTNNPNAYALERAKKFNVPYRVFGRDEFRQKDVVMGWLTEKNVTHVVLAGFLWLVPEYLIRAFPERIVNIHPSLLPRFGGKGMYGIKVHEAVRQSGEKETGMTIHVVNEKYDDGKVLFQAKCVINDADTPSEIAKKVNQLEYTSYPPVIEGWILNKLPATDVIKSVDAV